MRKVTARQVAGTSSSVQAAFVRKPPVTPGKKKGGALNAPPVASDVRQLFWIATPELVAMSTPRVSRRNNDPTIRVITATPMGYQRPA